MAIRDRARKILWSRAGNCCSICRTILVREGEVGEGLTVIGEECHIVSPATTGPRAGMPVDDLDDYKNLILLCPNDHRLVDTLIGDYPAARLQEIKRSHEDWVRKSLASNGGQSPMTIIRSAPTVLRSIGSSSDLLNVVVGSEESSLDHEEIDSEDELDTVAGFLQNLHDWPEIWDDLEPGARIRATFDLGREMKSLKEGGWLVFGARTHGKLRGGVSLVDSAWDTAYVRLVRVNSPAIIKLDLAGERAGNSEQDQE